jgi:MFS family permease
VHTASESTSTSTSPVALTEQVREQLERNVKLFRWSSFISGLIFIIPIWVLFEREFLTLWQMAVLEAVSMALTVGLELPTGALADLFGRKTSAGIGWLFQGVGSVLQGLSHEPILFTIGFAVFAIGVALVSGADSALLYDTLKQLGRPQAFQKEMSRSGLNMQIAIALGTFTGGWLYQIWIGLPYIGYGIGMLVAGWLFFMMREPDIDSEKFSWQAYRGQLSEGWREVTHSSWALWVGLLYVAVGGITWSGQLFFNNNFLVELGFTSLQLSWLLGSIRIINSFLLFRMLHLEKIVTARRVFVFFPIVMLIAYLPAYWVSGWWVYPLMMAAMLASTARHIVLGQLCHDVYTSKNRATALSTLNMGVSIWYVAAMLAGGWLMATISARMAYVALGLLTLLLVVPISLKLLTLKQQQTT